MKKIAILIFLFSSFFIRAQQHSKCSIPQIQLEIYEYTLKHLGSINKNYNPESVIETYVQFEKNKITDIKYFILAPDNNYSGTEKKKISIPNELNELIYKKFKCFEDEVEIDLISLSREIKFRIPLNEKNINTAISEVKPQ